MKLEKEAGPSSHGLQAIAPNHKGDEATIGSLVAAKLSFCFQGGGQIGIGKRAWNGFVTTLLQTRVIVVEIEMHMHSRDTIDRAEWDAGKREG